MTEATATDTTTEATTEAAGTETEQSTYTPPATQADLDRIIAERVARTKNQFKDYGDLKAKAAELDQIREANKTEAQRKDEELSKWQAEAEAWRTASITSRIEALAAPDFAFPADAVAKLDAAKYLEVGGVVNEDAIRADLAAILEERPNWRRPEAGTPGPRVPAPTASQGASGSAATDPAAQLGAIIQGQLRS